MDLSGISLIMIREIQKKNLKQFKIPQNEEKKLEEFYLLFNQKKFKEKVKDIVYDKFT